MIYIPALALSFILLLVVVILASFQFTEQRRKIGRQKGNRTNWSISLSFVFVVCVSSCRDDSLRTDKLIEKNRKACEELTDLRRQYYHEVDRFSQTDRYITSESKEEPAAASVIVRARFAKLTKELQATRLELVNLKSADKVIKDAISRADATLSESIPSVFRYIEGIDETPMELGTNEVLSDAFFSTVLTMPNPAGSLNDVLEVFKQNEASLNLTRSSFLIGEGGQLPVTNSSPTTMPERNFRFVIAWTKVGRADVYLGTPAGSRDGFLEVMAWDPKKRAFNFYERKNIKNPVWLWKGDSSHALQQPTRGTSCFRCHVNGAPIMRELNQPWNNWHSEAALITSTVPDEIRFVQPRRALFQGKSAAQTLEDLIIDGTNRWNRERIDRTLKGSSIQSLDQWTRQITTSTTVNLISSQTKSDGRLATQQETIDIPMSFFLNHKALKSVLDTELPRLDNKVKRTHYEAGIYKLGFKLHLHTKDTFFAFLVPEPSMEDLVAIRKLIEEKVVSKKLVASMLMVDFPNPVFSEARSELYRNIKDVQIGQFSSAGVSNVPHKIISKVRSLAKLPDHRPNSLVDVQKLTGTQQFLWYYTLPNNLFETTINEHLKEYIDGVQSKLNTESGVYGYLMLSVSRRNQFGGVLPGKVMINESPILFPSSNQSHKNLSMGANGNLVSP